MLCFFVFVCCNDIHDSGPIQHCRWHTWYVNIVMSVHLRLNKVCFLSILNERDAFV